MHQRRETQGVGAREVVGEPESPGGCECRRGLTRVSKSMTLSQANLLPVQGAGGILRQHPNSAGGSIFCKHRPCLTPCIQVAFRPVTLHFCDCGELTRPTRYRHLIYVTEQAVAPGCSILNDRSPSACRGSRDLTVSGREPVGISLLRRPRASVLCSCTPVTSRLIIRSSGAEGGLCLPSSRDHSLQGASAVHIQLISLSELRLEE